MTEMPLADVIVQEFHDKRYAHYEATPQPSPAPLLPTKLVLGYDKFDDLVNEVRSHHCFFDLLRLRAGGCDMILKHPDDVEDVRGWCWI